MGSIAGPNLLGNPLLQSASFEIRQGRKFNSDLSVQAPSNTTRYTHLEIVVGEVEIKGDGVNPLAAYNINASPLGGGQNGRALNVQFGHTAANGFKGWSDINYESGFQRNYYDSLQTKLTRQLGAGSQIGVLYTWSKAIDYTDNEDLGALAFPFPAYWQKDKALASFDRTNNFQAYGSYSLPFGREQRWAQSGLLNHVVGGWQLNWVLSRTSGAPFTITADGASAQAAGSQQTADVVGPIHILGGLPMTNCLATDLTCHYFDPAAFAQPTGVRYGTGGRDDVRGPGPFNLDANLFRNFKLTERFTLQFRGEAFGVTNTPHFGNPGANRAGTNFGIITSSSGECLMEALISENATRWKGVWW